MKEKVYVITDTECGWDCVIGVYKDKKALHAAITGLLSLSEPITELEKEINEEYIHNAIRDTSYIVHEVYLQS